MAHSLGKAPVQVEKAAAESNVLLGDDEHSLFEVRVRVDDAFRDFHRFVDLKRIDDDAGDGFLSFSHLNRYQR
jgi:hypothetical protein